ncbi:unnamed protein product, partial [Schistosoma margrebowiei]
DIITTGRLSWKITGLGWSFTRRQQYDANGGQAKFIQCPEGGMKKREEVVHTVAIDEIDVVISRT